MSLENQMRINIHMAQVPILDQKLDIKNHIISICDKYHFKVDSNNVDFYINASGILIILHNVSMLKQKDIIGPEISSPNSVSFLSRYTKCTIKKNRYVYRETLPSTLKRIPLFMKDLINNINWSYKIPFLYEIDNTTVTLRTPVPITYFKLQHENSILYTYGVSKNHLEKRSHQNNVITIKQQLDGYMRQYDVNTYANIGSLIDQWAGQYTEPTLEIVELGEANTLPTSIIYSYFTSEYILPLINSNGQFLNLAIIVKKKGVTSSDSSPRGLELLLLDAKNMFTRDCYNFQKSYNTNIKYYMGKYTYENHAKDALKTIKSLYKFFHLDSEPDIDDIKYEVLDKTSEMVQKHPNLIGEISKYMIPEKKLLIQALKEKKYQNYGSHDLMIFSILLNQIRYAKSVNKLPTSSKDSLGIKKKIRNFINILSHYPDISLNYISDIQSISYVKKYIATLSPINKLLKTQYQHPSLKISDHHIKRLKNLYKSLNNNVSEIEFEDHINILTLQKEILEFSRILLKEKIQHNSFLKKKLLEIIRKINRVLI